MLLKVFLTKTGDNARRRDTHGIIKILLGLSWHFLKET